MRADHPPDLKTVFPPPKYPEFSIPKGDLAHSCCLKDLTTSHGACKNPGMSENHHFWRRRRSGRQGRFQGGSQITEIHQDIQLYNSRIAVSTKSAKPKVAFECVWID